MGNSIKKVHDKDWTTANCETGIEDIFEDYLNGAGGAGHGNWLQLREETDCIFGEQNVHFSFGFTILYFLFVLFVH